MTRLYMPAVVAGVIATALAAPGARADEPEKPAQPGTPAAAPAPEMKKDEAPPPAAEPGGAQPVDPRDRRINDLERKLEEALKRIDDLEKKQRCDPPAPAGPAPNGPPMPNGTPTPDGTPAPMPEPTPEPTPAPRSGSATLIPNVSAIGNLILGAGDTHRVPNRGRFNFEEFEVALQDAVAPKLRYDVFLSAEKGEEWKVGMEEGYLTASALYPGLSARIGRIRTPFGKFNPLHSHVWPFITEPSAEAALLGPDGLISDGAVLEYNLPVKGFFAQGQFGWWQTTSDTEDGLGFGAGEVGAYSGRLWLGKDIGRNRELELGFSRYQGSGDVNPLEAAAVAAASKGGDGGVFGRFRKSLTGVDLTYRAYPGSTSRLLMSAELINLNTRLPGVDQNAMGGFAYAVYRFNQFYEAGIRGDYTRFPFPVDSYDWGGSLFFTKYITEQTSLRLEYQYTNSPLLGTGNGIYFQILFGSGPHTHPLQ